jgi:tRNA G18 (ribose-2'-O)-methylase SpoU
MAFSLPADVDSGLLDAAREVCALLGSCRPPLSISQLAHILPCLSISREIGIVSGESWASAKEALKGFVDGMVREDALDEVASTDSIACTALMVWLTQAAAAESKSEVVMELLAMTALRLMECDEQRAMQLGRALICSLFGVVQSPSRSPACRLRARTCILSAGLQALRWSSQLMQLPLSRHGDPVSQESSTEPSFLAGSSVTSSSRILARFISEIVKFENDEGIVIEGDDAALALGSELTRVFLSALSSPPGTADAARGEFLAALSGPVLLLEGPSRSFLQEAWEAMCSGGLGPVPLGVLCQTWGVMNENLKLFQCRRLWLGLLRGLESVNSVMVKRSLYLLRCCLGLDSAVGVASPSSEDSVLAEWRDYLVVWDTMEEESTSLLQKQTWPTVRLMCSHVEEHTVLGLTSSPNPETSEEHHHQPVATFPPSLREFCWVAPLLTRCLDAKRLEELIVGNLTFGNVAALSENWVVGVLLPLLGDTQKLWKRKQGSFAEGCKSWLSAYYEALSPSRRVSFTRLCIVALSGSQFQRLLVQPALVCAILDALAFSEEGGEESGAVDADMLVLLRIVIERAWEPWRDCIFLCTLRLLRDHTNWGDPRMRLISADGALRLDAPALLFLLSQSDRNLASPATTGEWRKWLKGGDHFLEGADCPSEVAVAAQKYVEIQAGDQGQDEMSSGVVLAEQRAQALCLCILCFSWDPWDFLLPAVEVLCVCGERPYMPKCRVWFSLAIMCCWFELGEPLSPFFDSCAVTAVDVVRTLLRTHLAEPCGGLSSELLALVRRAVFALSRSFPAFSSSALSLREWISLCHCSNLAALQVLDIALLCTNGEGSLPHAQAVNDLVLQISSCQEIQCGGALAWSCLERILSASSVTSTLPLGSLLSLLDAAAPESLPSAFACVSHILSTVPGGTLSLDTLDHAIQAMWISFKFASAPSLDLIRRAVHSCLAPIIFDVGGDVGAAAADAAMNMLEWCHPNGSPPVDFMEDCKYDLLEREVARHLCAMWSRYPQSLPAFERVIVQLLLHSGPTNLSVRSKPPPAADEQHGKLRCSARLMVLDFLESHASSEGALRADLARISLKLMMEAHSLAKPSSKLYSGGILFRVQVRTWQALCILCPCFCGAPPGSVVAMAAASIEEAFWKAVSGQAPSGVRRLMETVGSMLVRSGREEIFRELCHHLADCSISGPAACSLLIIAAQSLPLEAVLAEDQESRLVHASFRWLSASHAFARAGAQLLLLQLVSKGSRSLVLDEEGIRSIADFMEGNSSTRKLVQQKMRLLLSADELRAECTLKGMLLAHPVDETAQRDLSPLHASDVLRQTLRGEGAEAKAALIEHPVERPAPGNLLIQRKPQPWAELDQLLGLAQSRAEAKRRRKRFPFIMCASLVDTVPNLAGLARTCEVLGAERLLVPSAHVTSRDDFRNQAVTSHEWLPIDELRPADMESYLEDKRKEGYAILGLEQTNSSRCLSSMDSQSFPHRCVLVLGDPGTGLPVELLHCLDDCIEIPQVGLIRSLNVHVSGSIVLWQYASQRIRCAARETSD